MLKTTKQEEPSLPKQKISLHMLPLEPNPLCLATTKSNIHISVLVLQSLGWKSLKRRQQKGRKHKSILFRKLNKQPQQSNKHQNYKQPSETFESYVYMMICPWLHFKECLWIWFLDNRIFILCTPREFTS